MERRDVLARRQSQSGGRGGFDHRLRIHAIVRRRPRTAAAGFEIHDADASLRFQR